MGERDRVLNSEMLTGEEPSERIDVALRRAMTDLHAASFNLETGRINYGGMLGTPQFNVYVEMAGFLKKYDPSSLTAREQRLAF
jgi:hypothetical protein